MSMNRRRFLGGMAAALASANLMALPQPSWRPLPRRKAGVATRNTARNLIFVLLEGGASHVDTFDLKTGSWTPDLLGVQTLGGGLQWPSGIMPELAAMTDRFSIVRSISAVEAVHERGVYHLMTAHRQNAALFNEIPYFPSVMSHMLHNQRNPGDSLPTVMAAGDMGTGTGFLSADHQGLLLSEEGGIANLRHEFYGGDKRMNLLRDINNDMAYGDKRGNHHLFQKQGLDMMVDTELQGILGIDENQETDFEDMSAVFEAQCRTAVRAIAAGKGTRVFKMQLSGWDHHDNIYNAENLPTLARALDHGLAYLINQLSGIPGQNGGQTLLDETLIVAAGEFGRTVGRLNTSAGRDHHPAAMSAFFAGGGVKGGRIIGGTSSDGEYVTDPGWSRGRFIGVNDLMATAYSALGIDWTTRFEDTPSGRIFEIVDTGLTGEIYDIDTLFT